MSDEVLQRIASWQSAGLIDEATAERLRTSELTAGPESPAADPSPARPGMLASFFGPSVSIVEAFSYVGGAFLLASWSALIARLAGEASSDSTREWILVAGIAIAAAAFFVLGWILDDRSPRLNRAAGVMLFLSSMFVWGGAYANAEILMDGAIVAVVGAGAGLIAAFAYRRLHPALLTQLAVLATITGLVAAGLGLLDELLYPETSDPLGAFVQRGIESALIGAAVWLGCAVVIGLIALAESRSDDPAAARRAALTRFWAGVTAVSGVAYSLTRTNYDSTTGSYRIIEPWIADVAILVVSAVLLERAFRREAASYVVAATLGIIIALTDLNVTYFAPTSGGEVALLVEGLLLIAIAFAAERLSRRVTRREPPAVPPPAEPVADAEPSSA